jgi:cystathionine gamma-lyase
MIRSLKTLPIRMKQHFKNGMKIARFLEAHPCVLRAIHPGNNNLQYSYGIGVPRFFCFINFVSKGLRSHPQHELALQQQFGHSGMVTFLIKGELRESVAFLDALKVFKKAPSLGADVSIASIP